MGNGASRLDIGLPQLDPTTLTGVGAKCLHALQSNVTCANITGSVFSDDFRNLAYQDLNILCAGECAINLSLYQDALYWACSPRATWNDTRDSSIWPVTSCVDRIAHHLDLACLRRSDGQFCDDWFGQGAYEVETPECDECYLETLRLQAVSPMAEGIEDARSAYQSLSSSCTYTGAPVTRTVSSPMLSSPTGTPICDYMYSIQPGDSAISISQTQKVSTPGLLYTSRLRADILDIPADGELCIKNRCHTDAIRQGDTCDTLAASHNLTAHQLQAWNPWTFDLCNKLESMVDWLLCTSDFDANAFAAPTPDNIANGTNEFCAKFHEVAKDDTCPSIEMKHNIGLEDFLYLNQGISSNCTNLQPGKSYCVVPVGEISSYPDYSMFITPQDWSFDSLSLSWTPSWRGTLDYDSMGGAYHDGLLDNRDPAVNCWMYEHWEGKPPPSCEAFATHWRVTYNELVEWNPSLTDHSTVECEVLPRTTYCVKAPRPGRDLAMAGIMPVPRAKSEIFMCMEWIHGTEDCEAVIASSGLSRERFLEYNPAVGEDCSGMGPYMWYCVQTYANPTEWSAAISPAIAVWHGGKQQEVLRGPH